MSERTASERSTDGAPTGGRRASNTAGGHEATSKLARYARRGITSGAVAGILGGIVTLRGLQAMRRGHWGSGLVRIFFGGLLTAGAVGQRRRTSDRSEAAGPRRAEIGTRAPSRDDQSSTGVPVAAEPGTEGEERQSESEAPESEREAPSVEGFEGYRRMGAAAFDRESGRVPAPQHAFDMEYLVLNGEVYWGIRETDGVVVVSQRYDPIEDREDERYVASSEVDDERRVRIPDRILDHWEDQFDGGVAIESGDDIVFVRAGDLEADNQLVVVPEEWSDGLLGEAA